MNEDEINRLLGAVSLNANNSANGDPMNPILDSPQESREGAVESPTQELHSAVELAPHKRSEGELRLRGWTQTRDLDSSFYFHV